MKSDCWKAIIFDWDLTLWNSWDIHLRLMDLTADKLGAARPAEEEIAAEYSRPFLEHLEWFFPLDRETVEDTYLDFYYLAVGEMGGLYPGIPDMLSTLKNRGFKLAVLSDKRRSFGEPELEQAGIGPLLASTHFLTDGRPYKPDPRGLCEVCDTLNIRPEEAVYVGDGRQDIHCAHRAGATSAAALWACVDRESVLKLRPRYQWERVSQLTEDLT